MFFGLFKLFRHYALSLPILASYPAFTEKRCMQHAALPVSSKKVRRPEQDDYG